MTEHTANVPAADEPSTETTTTHAGWGEGNPQLRVSSESERFVFALDRDEITIGSSAENDLRLEGAEAAHARIQHDERDEYVLTMLAEGETSANPLASGTHPGDHSATLRTGAQFTAGPWTLVYFREEFADHGRPFGGRQGGELSDQPTQPDRPNYAAGEGGAGEDGRNAAQSSER